MTEFVIPLLSREPNPHYQHSGWRTFEPGLISTEVMDDGLIVITRDMLEVTTEVPSPTHIRVYGEMEVVCDTCGASFSWRDLETDDSTGADGEEFYSDTVCPCCGAWDCCNLVFAEEVVGVEAGDGKGERDAKG